MGKINKVAPYKLFIPGAHSNELSYVFIEPAGEHENGSRYVFGMFQVKAVSELYHNVIAQTVKNIVDYFQKTTPNLSHNPTEENGVSHAEFIFENALQYANEQLNTYLMEQGDSERFDVKKMNMVIGMVWDNELYVSSLGNEISVFYLYPVQKKDSFSHYSAISVLNDTEEAADTTSMRMFSNIVSGSLTIPESTLVVCNRSFLDYISLSQIKQAVTSYSHERLTPYFQNLLGKANTNIDFASLFLRLTAKGDELSHRAGNHSQTVSHHSMEGLVSTERDTESILSSAAGAQAKEMIISVTRNIIITPAKKVFSFVVTQVKTISIPNPSNLIKSEAVSQNLQSTKDKLKEKSHGLIIAFHKLRQSNKKEVFDNLWSATQEKATTHGKILKEKLLTLSATQKAILAVAVIFIALFAVSIVTQRAKQNDTAKQKAYEQSVASIKKSTFDAEARLIIDDEESSKALIAQAESLLATLPNETTDQKSKHDQLIEDINKVKAKISHITPLATTVIAELTNQVPTLDSLKMTAVAGTTLLYNQDSVYTLDAEKGKVLQINTQAKVPLITCAMVYDASTAYLCGSEAGRLFELNLKDQGVKPVAIKNEDGEFVTAATTYNKRLYFVDGNTGSLYRHTKSNDGFGSATVIASNLSELKNAQSIAIDGTIYVLAGNQLVKVANKQATPVLLPSVEPTLTSPSKVWTDDESAYLYIVDPSQKRIIMVDKRTNKIKMQLTATNLDQIKDVVVNEKKKEILILSGSQVVKAPLDFLK